MIHGFGGCCGFGGFGAFGSLGWIGWIINLVITVGVIIGFVLLVIWAVRRLSSARGSGMDSANVQTHSTATEILKARYARGEITREEYRQMLADLS
jgi:putative membrane protein